MEDQWCRRFNAAVGLVRSLPESVWLGLGSFQPSVDCKLKLYAFYKQATAGECTDPKPPFWNYISRAKWQAWSKLGNTSAPEAMKGYVSTLQEVVDSFSLDPNLEKEVGSLKEKWNRERGDQNFDLIGVLDEGDSVIQATQFTTTLDGDDESECDPVERRKNSQTSDDEAYTDASDRSLTNAALLKKHKGQSQEETDSGTSTISNDRIEANAAMIKRNKLATCIPNALNSSQELDICFDKGGLISFKGIVLKSKGERRRHSKKTLGLANGQGKDNVSKNTSKGSNAEGAQSGTNNYASTSKNGRGVLTGSQHSRRFGSGQSSGSGSSSPSVELLDYDPQISDILIRLQRDLRNILHRLELLENLLTAQQHVLKNTVDIVVQRGEKSMGNLFHLPWKTIFFILVWPFIANLGLRLLRYVISKRMLKRK